MRNWQERCTGAKIIGGEGLIINEAPDDEGLEQCKKLGNRLAAE